MKVLLRCLTLMVATTVAVAEDANSAKERFKAGSKAFLTDSASGALVEASTAAASGRPTPSAGPPASAVRLAAADSANSGLMFYVELVRPSGEVERVTSDRAFRSGERIRLHFVTNQDGRIVLSQRSPDGSVRVLFPDLRVRAGDNWIKAGVDTVLPSDQAWFKFDESAGTERVMVFLMAERSAALPTTPAAPTAAPPVLTAAASNDLVTCAQAIEGSKQLVLETTSHHLASVLPGCLESARGDKALVVEVDNVAAQPATYVVNSSPRGNGTGLVATEIVLEHR